MPPTTVRQIRSEQAAVLQRGAAEVEQDSQLQAGRSQIVDHLRLMHLGQRRDGLYLNQNFTRNHLICLRLTDQVPLPILSAKSAFLHTIHHQIRLIRGLI